MCECVYRLLLIAALPALAGWRGGGGGAVGEVVLAPPPAPPPPAFAPRPLTHVAAAAGDAATLRCTVAHLRDKTVSWVRSRDLQILTHAGAVFTADARVSAGEAGDDDDEGQGQQRSHWLRIARLRASDAGRYECQLNTEPKMSQLYNLTVLEAGAGHVRLWVTGEARQLFRRGDTRTLHCEARYEPATGAGALPPLAPRWHSPQGQPLHIEGGVGRGGVSLDSSQWEGGARVALTLGNLRAEDAGRYTCRVQGHSAAVTLSLRDPSDDYGPPLESMQRDESASRAAPPSPARLAAPAVAILLLSRLAAAFALQM